MNVFELVGTVALDGADKIDKQLSSLDKKAEKLSKGMKVAGAAFTAVGVAGLALIQKTKGMNAELEAAGVNIGLTRKEMRGLALDITNVTFPLDSVIDTFALLSRAGIDNEEDMRNVANGFDTLGDAVGKTAAEIAGPMITAAKTFGIGLDTLGDQNDRMTYLFKNTTLSVENFNSMIGYTTPEVVAAGLTIEDMTTIMGVLESKGVSGEVATRAWRSALTEAEKTGESMATTLGITTEEMDAYNKKVEASIGITQQYADIANSQFTIMDKVKQKFSELSLAASAYLEPLEPVLAGMTALGPVMMALSTSMAQKAIKTGLATVAMIAHKVAQTAVLIVTKPLTIATYAQAAAVKVLGMATKKALGIFGIILTVLALVAAVIMKNEEVMESLKEIFEDLMDAVMPIIDIFSTLISQIMDELKPVIELLMESFSKIIGLVAGVLSKVLIMLIETVLVPLAEMFAGLIVTMMPMIEKILPLMASLFTSLIEAVMPMIEILTTLGTTIMSKIIPIFMTLVETVMSVLIPVIEAILPVFEGITKGITWVMEKLTNYFSGAIKFWKDLFSGSIGKIKDDLIGGFTKIKDFIFGIWNKITDFFRDKLNWIKDTFSRVFTTLKDIMLSPFRAAMRGIESAINWLITQMNKISFTIPSWIPGIGGKSFGINIPKISLPSFDQGGLIPEPTLLYGLKSMKPYAIAGTGGVETVVPGRGGFGGGITINVQEMSIRDDRDIVLLAEEMFRLMLVEMRGQGG